MFFKTVPAKIEPAPESEPEGTFEALVSIFGNVDYQNERVQKGAFAENLKQWADSGDPIPVVWSHQADDPNMHLGVVEDAKETDDGLYVKARLDMDHPPAKRVYDLLKDRRVKQFSFAYDILDSAEKDGVTDLTKLAIHEVGPTPLGANPATQLIGTKKRGRKAGRVISAVNERALRAAIDHLVSILDQIEEQEIEEEEVEAPEDGPVPESEPEPQVTVEGHEPGGDATPAAASTSAESKALDGLVNAALADLIRLQG